MFNRIRRFVAWSKVVAILAALATVSANANPQQIYRKILPSVMTLEVETTSGRHFVGSAVLALGDDTALTASHVVNDARSVWAVFEDGTRVKVLGWVDRDSQRDLTLIKLQRSMPGRRATLSYELESVAATAYVIGTPKGYGFSISDGLVSQIRQVDGFAQYQISCPISAGNSGGPVLNDSGQVIGIVSWTKADAQNLSFAIPSREVSHLKADRKVSLWEQPRSGRRVSSAGAAANMETAVSAEQQDRSPASSFLDFNHRLAEAAGKKVTVVLQEEGGEQKFTFTVPSGLK